MTKTIVKSQKKPTKKPFIKSFIIWCTACGSNYTVDRKNDKGELIEQQICPHAILKKVLLK